MGYPYTVCYPLGLMYLASSLRTLGGHDVDIIDTKVDRLPLDRVIKRIGDFGAHVVGISGLTFEAGEIHRMAQEVKRAFPKKKVILGGPHATVAPAESATDPHVDFAVVGEGEQTLTELVRQIEAGNDTPDIPGLAYRRNGQPTIIPRQLPSLSMDDLPFPAWDLIDIEKYLGFTRQSIVYAERKYMTIFTSRGCPYQCIYCHPVFGKKYRTRSPENVLEEMKTLYHQYGIREFHFADDNFNLDHARAERICDLIIESGLKVYLSFPNGVRGDILTPRLLKKMKDAGTFMVSYAIETGSPRLQKLLKKNIDFDKITQTINETDRLGILCNGFFMLGFPGETREELDMTLNFAWNSRLHTASFYVVNPFPGTELFEITKEKIPAHLNDITQQEYNYLRSNYGLSEVGDQEVQRLVRLANQKFYLNPRRLLRTLAVIPRKEILVKLAAMFALRAFARG
jgi:radical SAM superfamily enzyme YgiQ (UPF0313 family)